MEAASQLELTGPQCILIPQSIPEKHPEPPLACHTFLLMVSSLLHDNYLIH